MLEFLSIHNGFIEPYTPDARPGEIASETATLIGRILVANGYIMRAGYFDTGLSSQTVATMIKEIGGCSRAPRGFDTEDGLLVGPHYMQIGTDEFVPRYGVGIWELRREA